MSENRAIVAGGTGLVGSFLLQHLAAHPAFGEVIALSRRDFDAPAGVTVKVIDMADMAKEAEAAHATHAFCALGTTIKTAGSQAAFRAVDFDLVDAFAKGAKAGGCQNFAAVSAMGANARSFNFYSRVKGEAESALRAAGFKGLTLARPGLLLGPRQEHRAGEALAMKIAPLTNALSQGPLKQFRAIQAEDIAKALIASALEPPLGTRTLTYSDLMAYAAKLS